MIALILKAGKAKILGVAAVLLAITSFVDWAVGHNVSLAALYILPMMLSALVLKPMESAALAVVCSYLRACFDTQASSTELTLRFVFAMAAYFLSGLFVTALVRNHELTVQHFARMQIEQGLRKEAEQQLELLVDSSPAAILTMDQRGIVLAANRAANTLLLPEDQKLQGRSIADYLPVFADALQVNIGPEGLRTATQCQGHRENGEIFLAHTWFSTYLSPEGARLSAIVVDASEEMRDREEQGLQHLLRGNRILAAGVSHEVRNFCGAMTLLCSQLSERYSLSSDQDFRGLWNMIEALESIATTQLQSKSSEVLEDVPLRSILDDLRIIVETNWREIDAIIRWNLPAKLPDVLAERHGLLQAFLNIVQNSHRAVQQQPKRELEVTVSPTGQKVLVRFRDTGLGVASPERLFQPFQPGAAGSGLGLYVSRSIVRSYGGELRYEPQPAGSCFAIELQAVPVR